MKILIISVIVFLGILYIYTFIKYKKRRKQEINAVGDYRRNYLKSNSPPNPSPDDGYTNYLTKYNSSLDYIEKETFLKEAAESEEPQKPTPKKLQF